MRLPFAFAIGLVVAAACALPVARAQPAAPPTAADLAPALSQMLGESMFREAQLRARLTAVSEQLEVETTHAHQLDERIKAFGTAPAQPVAPPPPAPAPAATSTVAHPVAPSPSASAPAATSPVAPSDTPAASAP